MLAKYLGWGSLSDVSSTKIDKRYSALLYPTLLYFFSLFIIFSGIWIGENYVVHGPEYVPGSTWNILATMWDAKRLTSIATDGYVWNGNAHQIQNIAYFPLYSILEKLLGLGVSLKNPFVLIFPSIIFGLLSALAFYQLALKLLPENFAKISLAGYVFYPGAVFFVRAYPVSLINLLVILTLLALVEGKNWKAALWSGIGSLSGPLMVFLSLAVVIKWIVDQWQNMKGGVAPSFSKVTSAFTLFLGFSLMAFSGFVSFLIYQLWAFGNPFAFIQVQSAWELEPKLITKIYNFFFFNNIVGSHHPSHFVHAITQGSLGTRDAHLHYLMNLVIFLILSAFIWYQRKLTPWYFTLFCVLFLGGYWWFMGSVSGIKATVRLIFPVIPAFLGLGFLAKQYPELAKISVIFFAILSFLESELMMQGFWVI